MLSIRMHFNPVYQQLKVQASDSRLAVSSLKIQLEEQQRTVNELKGSMDAIPQVEAELSRLNRDYLVTKDRYTSMVERRESARLSEEAVQDSSDISFRVIDPPIVPRTAFRVQIEHYCSQRFSCLRWRQE